MFQWQQLPYCNVLTVNVVQSGSVFQPDGTDNQCGAARVASVSGLGFLNPNGTIGLGLTIVTNDGGGAGGAPLHIDATLALPSASGTWRDNTGQTGAFTLVTGSPTPGTARPLPVPAFAGGLAAGGARVTNVGAPTAASDAANKTYVDAVTANVRTAMLGQKVWKARISGAGTKSTTGQYTSSRVGTGNYSVVFNVAGLNLPTGQFPIVVASAGSGTQSTAVVAVLGFSSTGGFLITVFTQVQTFNAGAAADIPIALMLTMPDADSGSPVPPLVPESLPPGAQCRTVDGTTTCELRVGQ